MKFNIITFGCKVNQYESNMMKEKMLSSNFLYEESFLKSDIVIVNTCSVTDFADKKCLKQVRRIKRENKNAVLVVTGCSTQNKQELYQTLGIDILLGNTDKSKVNILVEDYLKSKKKIVKFNNDRNIEFEDMTIKDFNHSRAYIKIEDGCDNFCSFCIIPYVRGSVRSKNFDEVIKEAQNLVSEGHKEIVLTGIHTGHYNYNGKDLTDLINELSKINNLLRIRISSIEITELNDKFLDMLKNNKKVVNHLHIPIQSGSDTVLKRMNRKYDLKYFTEEIKKIRSIRPDISITTDCIVGHPYETDECFKECLETCQKLEFSKIHVFPYSLRIGTAAALMPQIDNTLKKERVKKLLNLSESLEKNYYDKFKGKEVDVLIEEVKNNKSSGHTSNYLYVTLDKEYAKGDIVKIKL